MTLLALGGYAKSGKDSFVDALQEQFEYERTFMSKPLMNALLLLDPVIPITRLENLALLNQDYVKFSLLHEIVGYEASKDEPEVRRQLQILGTEIGRKMFGEDSWVKQIVAEVNGFHADFAAVTGIRYQNEMDAFDDAFFVWIDRPGIVPVNAHSSDNSLGPDDFDYIVENSGSLDDLAKRAADFHKDHMVIRYTERSDQPLFAKSNTPIKKK